MKAGLKKCVFYFIFQLTLNKKMMWRWCFHGMYTKWLVVKYDDEVTLATLVVNGR